MVNPIEYLQQVKLELSKVTWPKRQTTLNMTILVLTVSIIMGFYLGAIDLVFAWLIASMV